MSRIKSPYDSITFGNPLSLRVDSKYMSIITVAPCGRDVVLAGRKGLLVIDLDDPFAAPRWLHHETSWEVADVQWSPHPSKPSWVVSTSNQKAMVWNLSRPSNDAIEHVLHSHTRAITDIHFHPQNPEMLATCSVDSFVLAWDLRCPREPVMKWADWRDAASQVKWNYKDPNILASSHDNILHIWDVRKGAVPTKSFEAHDAKINCLDWSRENKFELISASNDMSVKFWSFNKEYEKPVYTIKTNFPVSKARHVPFGDHTCGIMPLRGGSNSVYIVDYKNKVGEAGLDPTYTFKGHTEPVKDFVWRSRRTLDSDVDDSEYQLVTWSSDRDLRLWPMDDEIYNSLNYKPKMPLSKGKIYPKFEYKSYRPEPYIETENKLIIRNKRKLDDSMYHETQKFNSAFNHLNWISGIKIGQSAFQNVNADPNSAAFGDNSNQPLNLGEEFSNVGHKFPKLRFERISVSTGVLVLSLSGPWSSENKDDLIFIRVEINFPVGYPSEKAIPKIKVEDTHDLKLEKKKEILDNLYEIATKYCSHNRFCLEPCLRFLLGEKVDLDLDSADTMETYDLEFKDENDLEALKSLSPDASDIDEDFEYNDVNAVSGQEIDAAGERAEPVVLKRTQFDSTPVSKGCGAIWTASGHLVCFFMKKNVDDDDHLIKFGQQGFSLVRNLKRKKIENGLQIESEKPINGELSNAEYSDDSDSSADSLSNDFDVFQYDRMYRTKVPDLLKTSNMQPFSNNAKSNPMSAPTERSHATANSKTSKNVIKIYDFRYLIPVKMELAFEYRILGDSPHVLAEHNALIAEKYGYLTVAHCWRMLAAISVKDAIIDEATAMKLLEKLGRDTSNIDLANCYRFFWGYHPFGAKWFVVQIFNYFKKLDDIQMLAMMSCILFENDQIKHNVNMPINSPFSNPVMSNELKKSILRNSQVKTTNLHLKGEPFLRSGSIMAPHSLVRNHSTVSFERKYSRSVFNSFNPTSPINLSQARVPSVSTLSSLDYDTRSFKSSSPAGDFLMGGSIPQNKRGIKHNGPSFIDYGSHVDSNHPISHLSRSVTSVMAATPLQPMQKTIYTQPIIEDLDGDTPNVHIQMQNISDLDLYTDQYSVNIEAFVDENELQSYRSEYASILFSWGLPANRLKVLKFNYTNKQNKPKSDDFQEHCGAIGWCKDIKIEDNDSSRTRWKKFHDKNKCNFCQFTVKKRLSVCSNCNHIMHDTCALIWWVEDKMTQCPSGCGCECLSRLK